MGPETLRNGLLCMCIRVRSAGSSSDGSARNMSWEAPKVNPLWPPLRLLPSPDLQHVAAAWDLTVAAAPAHTRSPFIRARRMGRGNRRSGGMADALDSKSSARKGVWVQVPPSVVQPAASIAAARKKLLELMKTQT